MKAEHIKSIQEGNSLRFYKSKEWLAKREEILIRDNYECQNCKAEGRLTIKENSRSSLEVHHIVELKQDPLLGLDNDNLITLCIDCHNEVHNRFGKIGKNKIEEKIPERW